MLAHIDAPPRDPVFSRSALLLAVLAAGAQLGLIFPPTVIRDPAPINHTRHIVPAVYLLPLWPAAHRQQLRSEHIAYAQIGLIGRGSGAGQRALAGRGHKHAGGPRPSAPPPTPPAPPNTYDGSRVYVEPELQHPVARDPTSDAPSYPDSLRRRGIEGLVVIRFIVDTMGHADSSTLRIVETTHPGFAQAVRVALPRMKFIPAELGGRHVPVLVMQEFRFVIAHPDSAGAKGTAHSRT